jgi:signal transduction histidine kinase
MVLKDSTGPTGAQGHGPAEGRSLEEFSRDVAHELKNPLGAARGALELLLDPEAPVAAAEQQKMLELALRNVQRALALLDDLRAGARDDAGG